jgi:hypothetical protein
VLIGDFLVNKDETGALNHWATNTIFTEHGNNSRALVLALVGSVVRCMMMSHPTTRLKATGDCELCPHTTPAQSAIEVVCTVDQLTVPEKMCNNPP